MYLKLNLLETRIFAETLTDHGIDCLFLFLFWIAAKGQGIPRDDILLHADNTDSTLLHLAVESGVAKVINMATTNVLHHELQSV